MKKLGFTLSEVLVTLAIIGVISALTIPTFVSNAENKANAAKLSSLITDVQTAFTNMITSEAVLEMEETEFGQKSADATATTSDRAGELSKYLKLAGSSNNMATFYGTESIVHIGNSASANAVTPSFNDIYQVKNGALLFYGIEAKTKASNNAATTSVDSSIGLVAIDVNGAAKPNLWGRDVFQFMLGSDGILYPAGGSDYQHVRSENATVPCTVGTNTIGCTNKLIQDGFKVNY